MINFLINKALALTGGENPLIINPPAGFPTDICSLLNGITDFLIKISIVIAPIIVLYAAFLFLSSAGDTKKIDTAKTTLLYVVIGLAVVFLARGLALVIGDVLGVGISGACGSQVVSPPAAGSGGINLQF